MPLINHIRLWWLSVILVMAIPVFSACSERSQDTDAHNNNEPTIQNADSFKIALPDTSPALSPAILYAQRIVSGEIKIKANKETYAWLDSLQSSTKSTRDLAYRVTEVMMNTATGFLSESAGAHLKTYFQVFPKEFIEHYRNASAFVQNKLIENCAYEFYASGEDYAADIDNYFTDIHQSDSTFSSADKQELAAIQKKLLAIVKTKNE